MGKVITLSDTSPPLPSSLVASSTFLSLKAVSPLTIPPLLRLTQSSPTPLRTCVTPSSSPSPISEPSPTSLIRISLGCSKGSPFASLTSPSPSRTCSRRPRARARMGWSSTSVPTWVWPPSPPLPWGFRLWRPYECTTANPTMTLDATSSPTQ
ncbi:hypothetical protein DEO72_LG6g1550 [Vigna unguiculata]|uniref:Uncharacterized protein n=1 Tax=Vigna unguiculata TaxID=3917 RepID=A0A4D6M828_VIGUN|nr:hypothetical protein DEO72_LG6g1550 [Vigna unguiculata]